MYLDKINMLLGPITDTVSEKTAMSFPIPTEKGCCVLYYDIRDEKDSGLKNVDVVTAALVNADSVTRVSPEEILNRDILRMMKTVGSDAGFMEVYRQRKKCEEAIDALIAESGFDARGFQALKNARKSKIERFIMELMQYASLLDLEQMYTELLSDLYAVLSDSEIELLEI